MEDQLDTNHDSDTYPTSLTDPQNVKELYQYTQNLLDSIQTKLQNMSDKIVSGIDQMGNCIDDLERNIGDIMTQAGVEECEK
ncbi:heat shock factor-binding protein 1-like [Photinus pyralis]|uniref:heat shock factor-binding protein 1-like n=1 Tax=Photinus pyralis TaxID=7054 RepID=UPI00126737BF|nr:heat shock factor-binding protein 1-like [Photinus pyralis]